MVSADSELHLFRFLSRLRARLKGSRDADQALRSSLRATAEFFAASSACLAVLPAGERRARLGFFLPTERAWDVDLLTRFLTRERPVIPKELLLVPIHRRQRLWGALVLRRDDVAFAPGEHKTLLEVAQTISELVQQIDRERISEVRSSINRKIMEEIRPKDLFYQILHGLRSLTGYDHSAALFIADERADLLELVAEQVTWRKGKSTKIGFHLQVKPERRALIQPGEVCGFDRREDGWFQWIGPEAKDLAALLDDAAEASGPSSRAGGMLCGTVVTRDGVLAVLKITCRAPGGFGPYESELVKSFLPHLSVALQNSRRAETLQARMLEAERKNAMANLARGVAHDVNNALGAVLPLIQQIREDCDAGRIDPQVLAGDLQSIERSFQVCRRIFGGMLAFARGATRRPGQADVGRAIESAMAILEDGMERRLVRRELSVPEGLPAIPARQADLEQVFLNLLANARDAMPEGGTLALSARVVDGNVEVLIEDTGCGIPEKNLPLIQVPFFTTKPSGSGLGLAVCRSILFELRGKLELESQEGKGTQVRVVLPVVGRSVGERES